MKPKNASNLPLKPTLWNAKGRSEHLGGDAETHVP